MSRVGYVAVVLIVFWGSVFFVVGRLMGAYQ